MLCAVIKTPSFEAIERANQEADLIELHLDEIKSLSDSKLQGLREACQKPVIFKGGLAVVNWLSAKPEFVDLPFHAPPGLFEEIKKNYPNIHRICSWHDFEKTPEKLDLVFERPAELYKVATFAKSTLDSLRMLQFVKNSSKPVLGICLGEEGRITRILSAVMGSPFTYAPLEEGQKTAPGQLLLHELKTLYHYHSLHPHTPLYGLIGDPVSYSSSHLTHNFAFDRLEVDAVYVKMCVKKEELSAFFSQAIALGFRGFSVTMPLKEAVLPFLKQRHESCGAVNTIAVINGELHGWNTDGKGALAALTKKESIEKKHVVILGAGGTARAIAAEALKLGAKVTILNRTLLRAESAAKELGCAAGSLTIFPEVARNGYDCVINCTPLGMGDNRQSPVDTDLLLENRLVMDAVAHPEITPFLAAARRKKCRVIKGTDLFVQQAVEQLCIWFSHASENH